MKMLIGIVLCLVSLAGGAQVFASTGNADVVSTPSITAETNMQRADINFAGDLRQTSSRKIPSPKAPAADDSYGGTCHCFCVKGTWQCNNTGCGLHGGGCPGSQDQSHGLSGPDPRVQLQLDSPLNRRGFR